MYYCEAAYRLSPILHGMVATPRHAKEAGGGVARESAIPARPHRAPSALGLPRCHRGERRALSARVMLHGRHAVQEWLRAPMYGQRSWTGLLYRLAALTLVARAVQQRDAVQGVVGLGHPALLGVYDQVGEARDTPATGTLATRASSR